MMKKFHAVKTGIKSLFLLCFLFFVHSFVVAQQPDFSGTWVLNLEKSKLESMPQGLTSSIFIIKQEGKKIRLTRYHISGEEKNRISFRMKADSVTRRVKLLFKGNLSWQGNSLVAKLWRKNFSNTVVYTFGSSSNEFIADEVMKSPSDNHHNIWVFERQAVQ